MMSNDEHTPNTSPALLPKTNNLLFIKRFLSPSILVHNHPSGDPTPSAADIEMTREVQAAAEVLGISLHDHLVIGRKGHASFKSLGLI